MDSIIQLPDGWCINSLGVRFWPLHPDPRVIDIRNTARVLSKMCRFGGRIETFYSVAQHATLCSMLCAPEIALEALCHDNSECEMFDAPRPIKDMLVGFKKIEEGWMSAYDTALGLNGRLANMPHDRIKEVDNRMLMTEKRDLLPRCPDDWRIEEKPYPQRIVPWGSAFAEACFLRRYKELTEGIPSETAEWIEWHNQQYDAFQKACHKNPWIYQAMKMEEHGELSANVALMIACTQLAEQNEVMREHLNVQALHKTASIFVPSNYPKQPTEQKG